MLQLSQAHCFFCPIDTLKKRKVTKIASVGNYRSMQRQLDNENVFPDTLFYVCLCVSRQKSVCVRHKLANVRVCVCVCMCVYVCVRLSDRERKRERGREREMD